MIIKSKLVSKISQKMVNLSEREVAQGVALIIDKICDALTHQTRVEIRDFGAFSLRYRPARLAHNPKTGKKLKTDPKYVVHFKVGKKMREKINAMYGAKIFKNKDEPLG